jgi:polysaccharide biosynthesis transport protein
LDASDIGLTPPPEEPSRPAPAHEQHSGFSNIFRAADEESIDLVEIFNVLRRRYRVILAVMVIVTATSAAVILQLTPRYAAEASLLLDMRKTQVVDLQSVVSGLPPDNAAVRSEVEVLVSATIAEAVAKKMNLAALPEFNPKLRPPSMFAELGQGLHDIFPLIGVDAKPTDDLDPAQSELTEATRLLQGRTEASNDGRSYVLRVRSESENPQLAAALANAYADTYLNAQLEAKFEAVRRANDWLNDHLTDLRKQVEVADRAVEAFRSEHKLTQTRGETVTGQQLSELNSQLIIASADRAQKEASLRQIQDQLRAGGVDAAAQVLASPLIQQLRKEETDLRGQEAQLATRYRPAHPTMINIKAQEHDLEQKIADEINKVVRGIAGDVTAARARETSLRQGLDQLQKSSALLDQTTVQLQELERQAEASRTLYENFLNRFKETTAQQDIQQPDARLIAAARVPPAPIYPRTWMLIGLSVIGSVLLGLGAAFGAEQLDNGFRTGEQLERIGRVTSLGLLPALRGRESPHEAVVKHPTAPYSEAIRSIRTALRYSAIDNPPKVVLVTSSLPGEGKSATALSLARSVARSGGKALLIDCDLRRPSIAKLLNAEGTTGILSLFEPSPDIDAAIQVDAASGMHFVSSAAGTSNPQDLLGSKQLQAVIQALRPRYDMIVLDTPPILAVSDALILSHLVDTSIFLVRWGQTPRRVVLGALRSLRQNGGPLAGVVLSRVDLRRHATYGYGDSGYFYGQYGRRYYGNYGEH